MAESAIRAFAPRGIILSGGPNSVYEAEDWHAPQCVFELGVPVLGTEQNPGCLGPNVEAVRQRCASTLAKMHFDACEDGLLGQLEALCDAPEVVLAGCEAHVCLLQTALGLRRAGREIWVVADACGPRAPADHTLAMPRLRDVGARIVGTEMVLFEWVHDCRHPAFKQVLGLVKTR